MRALAADRKSATMPNAPIASEIHQALDRLLKVAAQIAFDFVIGIDHLADMDLLIGGEVVGLDRGIDFRRGENLQRARPADSVNIGERYIHPLVFRQFNSSYSCHRVNPFLALALLVARVGAQDAHDAFAAYDLAVLTNLFYRSSNLHNRQSLSSAEPLP
jgi:hypothetical protein